MYTIYETQTFLELFLNWFAISSSFVISLVPREHLLKLSWLFIFMKQIKTG
jgi:hypothetical protein